MKILFTLRIATILLFISAFNIYSQGTIKGIVTDSLTGDRLVGANVFLEGTSHGAAANIEGVYIIKGIPEGKYNIVFSYIGYKAKFVSVNVVKNKTVELNMDLSPEIVEGQEVIVTGQQRGQVSAINQQINSNTIVNVVSEEKIQELPDANAAEVIGRMPGVSISRSGGEADKITLRGLSDKFGTVTVDGMRMAPTDADSRGMDLSTISQGSLSGIELYKAITPDKDGDAIAGSVNLVTRIAPEERLIRVDAKGTYNNMEESVNQYDFSLRYGERFFDGLLGVQVLGNIEKKDRSNERINVDYGQAPNNVNDWEISDFTVEYTKEIRKRGGASLLIDYKTPDNGIIRFNNIFNSTKRDYITYSRNYPTGNEDLLYTARDRELEIKTFNSSLRGENHLFGLDIVWGASFALSNSQTPYDYYMDFLEPSSLNSQGNPISKMSVIPDYVKKGNPEGLIPYALNNYKKAFLNWGYFRDTENEDNEKAGFLDVLRKINLTDKISWEIKAGAKYRAKSRFKKTSELDAAYYLYGYHKYTILPDGSVVLKNFAGTRFENLLVENNAIISTNFLTLDPENRYTFDDKYFLNPMINRQSLRDWYSLNKNGAANANGTSLEYADNQERRSEYYDINENVFATYLMNTFNIGKDITIIAGARLEHENNEYFSKFTPGKLTGFPTPSGTLKDTSSTYNETVILPNMHLTYRPTDFMNVRLAVYKALARPDFNHRLEYYVARDGGGYTTLVVGNPDLKTAEAWNFEINTSFYGGKVGLFSISAFYKEIKNMYHVINNLRVDNTEILNELGIKWKSPFGTSQVYNLTYPYNSDKPTKVWGFEIEEQTNLHFLPGYLQFIVVGFNFSWVRSETYTLNSETVTWRDSLELFPGSGIWIPRENSKIVLSDSKNKLEGQPEFFGNFSIGYDYGGFSGRVSVFYQGEYNSRFSGDKKSDLIVGSFTRWDLALKYKFNDNLSVFFNFNNFTDVEESTYTANRVNNWELVNTKEKYDFTADLGLRVTL
ncbi:MAG TPA: TonB-dependent receptor [Melioribacteraceae bacterium]|nr:TonB-dependent receptor [Melioribacteraceae bacterium]